MTTTIKLNLTKDQSVRLDMLSNELRRDPEEIVRSAIALYEQVQAEKKHGYKVGLEKDGVFYGLKGVV